MLLLLDLGPLGFRIGLRIKSNGRGKEERENGEKRKCIQFQGTLNAIVVESCKPAQSLYLSAEPCN
jgi:hypothetical protein